MRWFVLAALLLPPVAFAQSAGRPSAVGPNGVSAVAITAPSVAVKTITADAVLTRRGSGRRTAGTQIVDATTGTATLPPNAAAAGKACALDTSKYGMKASWTSATSGQYTGCVFDGTWNLSGASYLWIDLGFDISAYATSLWVLLSSDATLSSYTNYSNSADQWLNVMKPVRGWLPIKIADLTPHGSPDLAAVKHIEIRFIKKTANTADAWGVYFYGVWTDLAARPKILIGHDDAFANWYQYAWPAMRAAGIKGSLYVNGASIGTANYMTAAQLHEVEAGGVTIGSHGWGHKNYSLAPISSYTRSSGTATLVTAWAHGLTNGNSITIAGCDQSGYNGTFTVTVSDATTVTFTLATQDPDTTARGWCYISGGVAADVYKADARRNLEWLQANGFGFGGAHFAYAYGAYDPDVMAALGSSGFGYSTARTILSTLSAGTPQFYTFAGLPTPVAMALPSYAMDSSSSSHTPANILGQVDTAIATGASIILYGHSINPTNGAATLCTAAATPYPCCTGTGTGTGCASATEQYLGDFQAVIDGLVTRCLVNNQCDLVTVADWYSKL